MSLRVLIVDDSPLIRTMLRDMISNEPGMEVAGAAMNGQEAVHMVEQLKPDVVTMDVEMPRMSGLEAVQAIMRSNPVPIVMISTLTSAGAETTLEALSYGAIDFICKPNDGSIREFRTLHHELIAKIKNASTAKVHTKILAVRSCAKPATVADRVVVIASSTGGPRALGTVWEQWPKGLSVPILMVQHMPASFTASLANRLNSMGTVPCREAKQGDQVEPGVALMAPGGFHMRVQAGGILTLDEEPTIHGVRPAADYLFQSAAALYGSKVVGMVLTGMGRDGAAGSVAIKNHGGIVFGESESTATVYGMPKAAKDADAIYAEFPIDEIGQALVATLGRRIANAS